MSLVILLPTANEPIIIMVVIKIPKSEFGYNLHLRISFSHPSVPQHKPQAENIIKYYLLYF
jgi:hypothetical protein